MRIGPLTEEQIERVKSLLESRAYSYELVMETDESTVRSVEERSTLLAIPKSLAYLGPKKDLYLELSDDAIEGIHTELAESGLIVTETFELDDRPEFLCEVCGYRSDSQGLCPKHRSVLLEFSEWNARRNNKPLWRKLLGL